MFDPALTHVLGWATQVLASAMQSFFELGMLSHLLCGRVHGLVGPTHALVQYTQVAPSLHWLLCTQVSPLSEQRPFDGPGQSSAPWQVSSVVSQRVFTGQSSWVEQPEGGVPPAAQLPPDEACGHSASVVQLLVGSFMQYLAAAHWPPGLVHTAPP